LKTSGFARGNRTSPKLAADSQPAAVRQAAKASADPSHNLAIAIVLAGLFYNAALAVLNAHGLRMSMPFVIVTEGIVLMAAVYVLLTSGRHSLDTFPLFILAFFLANALIVSLISGTLFIDMARNGAIIALFTMIGARLTERSVSRCFYLATMAIFAFMILEIISVETYAALFKPGQFYENTRGMEEFELNELGLFRNALGFEGRFSIFKISDHRVSSLYLEQVSLANFSTIIALFLLAFWNRIAVWQRWFYVAVVVLILLANSSRTALALALFAPVCWHLAPYLGRYGSLLVMPVVLGASAVFASFAPASEEDNLVGRLGLTMRSLADLDLPTLLGSNAPRATEFADSGYTYMIYGTTIFGLVFLWLIVSLILPNLNAAQKRVSLFLGAFVFVNLLIGGNAIFTIKIAALLWVLIGFLRNDQGPQEPSLASARPSGARRGG
jgi:hypothetical protein